MSNPKLKYFAAAAIAAMLSGLSYWMAINPIWTNYDGLFALQGMVVAGLLSGLCAAAASMAGIEAAVTRALASTWAIAAKLTRWFLAVDIKKDAEPTKATWSILAGCRMFLALVVVCSHMSLFTTLTGLYDKMRGLNGVDAVLCFLFISGFSICHSVTKESNGFLKRRFWRIMPVYWTCMAISVLPYVLGTGHAARNYGFRLTGSIHDMIWHIVPLDVLRVPTAWSNPVTWSLSIEVIFYALATLLRRSPTWLLLVLVAFSANYYDFSAILSHEHVKYPGVSLVQYGWAWLAGFVYYRHYGKLAAQILPMICAYELTHYSMYGLPHGIVMAGVFGGIVILAKFLPVADLKKFGKALNWLGDVSYPLYMVHFAVLWIVLLGSGASACWIYLVVALATATVIFYSVDYQLRRKKRSLKQNAPLSRQVGLDACPVTACDGAAIK